MDQFNLRHVADVAAAGSIVTAILGWMPHIGATLGVIWYLWLMWDKIKAKRRENRHTHR